MDVWEGILLLVKIENMEKLLYTKEIFNLIHENIK